MEELIRKLNDIPHSYFDFVAGVVAYARKKPERLERVLQYIDNTDDITSSDVVKFVMMQSDFHEDGVRQQEIAG